jgi:hypothetical protein
VSDIFPVKKIENETCESLKSLKVAKLEDASVIWIGEVNAKNEAATDEVIKEQAK